MRIPLYQVDAFTSEVFAGNPAAVCLLDRWIDDSILQAVAAENNLPETAFLVRDAKGYALRWFTPVTEVALCGHATLASAFVLFICQKWPEEYIRFQTRESGVLVVTRRDDLFEMDFPARPAYAQTPPAGLNEALRVTPQEVLGSAEDLLVVLDSERDRQSSAARYYGPGTCNMSRYHHYSQRGSERLRIALLRTPSRHTRGSGDRIGALCFGSLLGRCASQERSSCVSSLEARRRVVLHACWRAREDIRQSDSLYGGHNNRMKCRTNRVQATLASSPDPQHWPLRRYCDVS